MSQLSPSDLSRQLRSIAQRLDASRAPSRSAVAAELRRLVAAVIFTEEEFDINEYIEPGQSVESFFSWLPPLNSESKPSELLWHAMKEAGFKSWSPTNYQKIDSAFRKVKERYIDATWAARDEGLLPPGHHWQKVILDADNYEQDNYDEFINQIWPYMKEKQITDYKKLHFVPMK